MASCFGRFGDGSKGCLSEIPLLILLDPNAFPILKIRRLEFQWQLHILVLNTNKLPKKFRNARYTLIQVNSTKIIMITSIFFSIFSGLGKLGFSRNCTPTSHHLQAYSTSLTMWLTDRQRWLKN